MKNQGPVLVIALAGSINAGTLAKAVDDAGLLAALRPFEELLEAAYQRSGREGT